MSRLYAGLTANTSINYDDSTAEGALGSVCPGAPQNATLKVGVLNNQSSGVK